MKRVTFKGDYKSSKKFINASSNRIKSTMKLISINQEYQFLINHYFYSDIDQVYFKYSNVKKRELFNHQFLYYQHRRIQQFRQIFRTYIYNKDRKTENLFACFPQALYLKQRITSRSNKLCIAIHPTCNHPHFALFIQILPNNQFKLKFIKSQQIHPVSDTHIQFVHHPANQQDQNRLKHRMAKVFRVMTIASMIQQEINLQGKWAQLIMNPKSSLQKYFPQYNELSQMQIIREVYKQNQSIVQKARQVSNRLNEKELQFVLIGILSAKKNIEEIGFVTNMLKLQMV